MSYVLVLYRLAIRYAPEALIAIVGAVLFHRSARWFTHCGQLVRTAEWHADRCSECGRRVVTAGAGRQVAGLAVGVAAQGPILLSASQFEGARTAVFIVAIAVVGTAGLVELWLGGRTGAVRSRRRRFAILVSCLLLQVPWTLVAWRVTTSQAVKDSAEQWTGLRYIDAWTPRTSAFGPAEVWLAWMPDRWLWSTGAQRITLWVQSTAGWDSLGDGDPQFVERIEARHGATTAPTADQIRALARFTRLAELELPSMEATPDRLEALASLPAGCRVFASLVDAGNTPLGRFHATIPASGSNAAVVFELVSRDPPPAPAPLAPSEPMGPPAPLQ
ncbi:MAG: hypothetical protein SGJ11_15410 [Phycisphaerae bacterium]|nr:hypothetical protein [Phycisphaerae bacterium]